MLSVFVSMSLISCTDSKVKTEELKGDIVIWDTLDTQKALLQAAHDFKEKHPNVSIDILHHDDTYSDLSSDIVKGTKMPDIVCMKDVYIPYFLDKYGQNFMALSNAIPSIKNNFLKNALDYSSKGGNFYAIPYNAEPYAVIYRKDVYSKNNINPDDVKTWDDYIKLSEKFKKENNAESISVVQDDQTALYRVLLNELRASYFDKNGKCTVYSDKSQKAMLLLKRMYDEGLTTQVRDANDIANDLKNGALYQTVVSESQISDIMNSYSELSGKLGVMYIPAFENGGNTYASLMDTSLLISSQTKNKKAAVEFLKFASSNYKTLSANLKKNDLFPACVPFYDEKIFDEKVPYFDGNEIWNMFSRIAQESPEDFTGVQYKDVDDSINKIITQITNQSMDVAGELQKVQENINSVK